MLGLPPRLRCFLCLRATDMRSGFDSLSGIVRTWMRGDPLSGDLFVFVNRARTHIKMLYWDEDGFVVVYKRLEQGTFTVTYAAAGNDQTARQMQRDELLLLLAGIDQATTQRRKRYVVSASSV